ncbi:MAG: hypothetical protein FWE86_01680 [Oscillospiraceae bacterium]|nr:hypothetical protein [Oscillospiraceae bacterium]
MDIRIKKYLTAGFAVFGAAGLMLMPGDAAAGARSAVETCQSMVIPALFPMMFAASFIMESGAAAHLGRRLSAPARVLFGLPGEAGAAVLMAMTGGYPTGAAVISSLRERGAVTRRQAARMALFCVVPGPAFVVGAVGTHLLGSARAGFVILAAQLISVVIMGFLTRFLPESNGVSRMFSHGSSAAFSHGSSKAGTFPHRSSETPTPTPPDDPQFSNAIVAAARKSASSMMTVCAFVILFGAAVSVLRAAGVTRAAANLLTAAGLPRNVAESLLPMMLEVTGGCAGMSRPNTPAGILLLAFCVGFGGLAVHFQVFSMLGDVPVSRPLFFAARLLQGGVACLLTWIMIPLMKIDAAVGGAVPASALPDAPAVAHAMPTAVGSVFLVVMCAMFLFVTNTNHPGASRHPSTEGNLPTSQ